MWEGDLLVRPERLRSLPSERERDLERESDVCLRRMFLDLGGGVGLRDEKEGERRLRFLLGEREREVSDGSKDLARSPRPRYLRPLSLLDPRRTGVGERLGVYRCRRGLARSSSRRLCRLGGDLDLDREREKDLRREGERSRRPSERRVSRPPGI